ncbi:MAG: hypothetical protein ABSH22_03495 [Tepidisphaeraceae bacterium]|jgi:hypothetical protein
MAAGEFGCEQCFKADAQAMALAKTKFRLLARLVDEEHFIVSILACPECGQRCVSIFTETIDWVGGDDSQYVSVLPITEEEAAALVASGNDLVKRIEALGRGRPVWRDDDPTGGPRRIWWGKEGLWIGGLD